MLERGKTARCQLLREHIGIQSSEVAPAFTFCIKSRKTADFATAGPPVLAFSGQGLAPCGGQMADPSVHQ